MSEEEKLKFKLSDSVLQRIVQIVQEGMLLAGDVVDLLRQLELEACSDDPTKLVLTSEYVELVKRSHDDLLERVEEFKLSRELMKGN